MTALEVVFLSTMGLSGAGVLGGLIALVVIAAAAWWTRAPNAVPPAGSPGPLPADPFAADRDDREIQEARAGVDEALDDLKR